MQPPMTTEEPMLEKVEKPEMTMEERLAKVGAKIDTLIVKANEAKDEVKAKKEKSMKRGEEALDEMKLALDHAWNDLNQAWKEIKEGTERAAQKFRAE